MENQERLAALSINLVAPTIQDDAEPQGRVSLRATSRDRLPIVGEMPGQSGLMINTGHGSRGLTWCPLLAEVLAASCCGEPNPVPLSLLRALRPERVIEE
jgi:tRNA 5-methylaminomethyl-2-thiouridine biosynthesis bifunctional protein